LLATVFVTGHAGERAIASGAHRHAKQISRSPPWTTLDTGRASIADDAIRRTMRVVSA